MHGRFTRINNQAAFFTAAGKSASGQTLTKFSA